MINIIDTYADIPTLFENGEFSFEKWKIYADKIYSGLLKMLEDEIGEYIRSGNYSFDEDFLPIINAVCDNKRLKKLDILFREITDGIDEKIKEKFGKEIDTDIVFYLGICTGAGSAGKINGRNTVMLGAEKIIELGWDTKDDMYALIYHELGHIYHGQYGMLEQEAESNEQNFVFRLFCEGIAMYFEQVLVGDTEYYHQDKNGWKSFCEKNFLRIICDFNAELPKMEQFTQRYFGDWCDYYGYGDVGYYLGAKFVHWLLDKNRLDEIIGFDIETVYNFYGKFADEYIGKSRPPLKGVA